MKIPVQIREELSGNPSMKLLVGSVTFEHRNLVPRQEQVAFDINAYFKSLVVSHFEDFIYGELQKELGRFLRQLEEYFCSKTPVPSPQEQDLIKRGAELWELLLCEVDHGQQKEIT